MNNHRFFGIFFTPFGKKNIKNEKAIIFSLTTFYLNANETLFPYFKFKNRQEKIQIR